MLQLDTLQTIEEEQVFSDDRQNHLFYIVPSTVRYCLDDDGLPLIRLFKYQSSAGRGGYFVVDVECGISETKLKLVTQELQNQLNQSVTASKPIRQVRLEPLPIADGTAEFFLLGESTELLTNVNTKASFAVGLSPEWTTLLEETMFKAEESSPLAVAFDLKYYGKFRSACLNIHFDAGRFFERYPLLGDHWPTESELRSIEDELVSFEFEQHLDDESTRDQMLGLAAHALEGRFAILNQIRTLARQGVLDTVAGLMEEEESRQLEVAFGETLQETVEPMVTFGLTHYKDIVVERTVAPQAHLPSLAAFLDSLGAPYRSEDFVQEVNLDVLLHKQLSGSVGS